MTIEQEHESLLDNIAKAYAEAKRLNLMRTMSALNDAQRLAHWESAIYFDKGYVPKRQSDIHDVHTMVHSIEDEVTSI